MNSHIKLFSIILIIGTVISCGSGNGVNSDVSGRNGTDKTRLTLKITDAPIDGISEVWIQFYAIEFKPVDGDRIRFDLDSPRNINVLSLTGAKSEILLDQVAIPAGDYEWIRLYVNANLDDTLDSRVQLQDGSQLELEIPSGDSSGLQLVQGFSAIPAEPLHLTVDFDLRKSIAYTGNGRYILRPVIQMVDDRIAGSISGTIDPNMLVDSHCSDTDPSTGNAVYVFAGNNITPDDIDGIIPDPYATTIVEFNTRSGDYQFEVGFLPEGQYTVAFTCQSDLDELSTDENILFDIVNRNVNVTRSGEYENTFR